MSDAPKPRRLLDGSIAPLPPATPTEPSDPRSKPTLDEAMRQAADAVIDYERRTSQPFPSDTGHSDPHSPEGKALVALAKAWLGAMETDASWDERNAAHQAFLDGITMSEDVARFLVATEDRATALQGALADAHRAVNSYSERTHERGLRIQALEAERDRLWDGIEAAWGIIANASGGDWPRESPDWQEAAARWRDEYTPGMWEHVRRTRASQPGQP